MYKIYIKQIMSGKMTILDVPDKWEDLVRTTFDKMLEDGQITEDEYNKYMNRDDQNVF